MAVEGPNADAASSDQVDDIIQYPFSFLSNAYRINEPGFLKYSFKCTDN